MYMERMFKDSQFNGDIGTWDTSAVLDMSHMFEGSEFTGDLSRFMLKTAV